MLRIGEAATAKKHRKTPPSRASARRPDRKPAPTPPEGAHESAIRRVGITVIAGCIVLVIGFAAGNIEKRAEAAFDSQPAVQAVVTTIGANYYASESPLTRETLVARGESEAPAIWAKRAGYFPVCQEDIDVGLHVNRDVYVQVGKLIVPMRRSRAPAGGSVLAIGGGAEQTAEADVNLDSTPVSVYWYGPGATALHHHGLHVHLERGDSLDIDVRATTRRGATWRGTLIYDVDGRPTSVDLGTHTELALPSPYVAPSYMSGGAHLSSSSIDPPCPGL
jgi:hypothetical protein